MGKKGSWFSAVKKVLNHNSENKDKKLNKSKKKWFKEEESTDVISFLEQSPLYVPAQPPIEDDVKQNIEDDVKQNTEDNVKQNIEDDVKQNTEDDVKQNTEDDIKQNTEDDIKQTELENEQSGHAHFKAAEPAVAAARPAMGVEHSPSIIYFHPEMLEEIAAIMIQTAFRGYLARKELRALKALMRLEALLQGQSLKRQVASTLKSMQSIAHVQSEIRARRMRMSEENQALHRQLHKKREKPLEKSKTSIDEDWNRSTQSKAQVEAKRLNKQVAAIRRERALAYAYSHQQTWKNSLKIATLTVMDPNNPHWGWSWLERWMAARPWELRSAADHPDHVSVMSVATRASVVDIIQIYARRDQNSPTKLSPKTPTSQKSSQLHRQPSPSTPKALSSSSGRKKTNPGKSRVGSWGGDDDLRSTVSVKSKLSRRHTIAGSSFRDDASLVKLASVSSYTAPLKAVKTRSRLASSSGTEKKGTMEKGSASAGSAKKRLSFTASPAKVRRQSSPPIVNTS